MGMVKDEIVNLKTLADIIGCSNGYIYTLIRLGMPYHQLDPKSRRYFVVDEVVNWLKTAGFRQVITWKAR